MSLLVNSYFLAINKMKTALTTMTMAATTAATMKKKKKHTQPEIINGKKACVDTGQRKHVLNGYKIK